MNKFLPFNYPPCQVCGKPTPTHTKRGKRITHSRRMQTLTCGSAACHGEMIVRSREVKAAERCVGQKVVFRRKPPALTAQDKGFDMFNLGLRGAGL